MSGGVRAARVVAPVLLVGGLVAACTPPGEHLPPAELALGDPVRGRELIQEYGCGSCHTIPGLPQADGLVGPPLIQWGRRTYIAGTLVNTPENLVLWIVEPQDVEPGTAMPDLGVPPVDARDIAAYLYTLE